MADFEFGNLGGLILVAIVLAVLIPVAFFILDAFFSDASDISHATKNGLKRLAIELDDVGDTDKFIPLALNGAYIVGKNAIGTSVLMGDSVSIEIKNKECRDVSCLCAYASKEDVETKQPGLCIPFEQYDCMYFVGGDGNITNLGNTYRTGEYVVMTSEDKGLLQVRKETNCPGSGDGLSFRVDSPRPSEDPYYNDGNPTTGWQ